MAKGGCGTLTATASASFILLMGWAASGAGGADRAAITLREARRNGTSTRVQTELKAKGLYRPGLPPGDAAALGKMPKPLQVEIETRFVFNERLVANNQRDIGVGKFRPPEWRGSARRRRSSKGCAARDSGGLGNQRRSQAYVCADSSGGPASGRRARNGDVSVVVVSPTGPLTWYELELLQGLGDPLVLGDLLPDRPVRVGDRWRVATPGHKH